MAENDPEPKDMVELGGGTFFYMRSKQFPLRLRHLQNMVFESVNSSFFKHRKTLVTPFIVDIREIKSHLVTNQDYTRDDYSIRRFGMSNRRLFQLMWGPVSIITELTWSQLRCLSSSWEKKLITRYFSYEVSTHRICRTSCKPFHLLPRSIGRSVASDARVLRSLHWPVRTPTICPMSKLYDYIKSNQVNLTDGMGYLGFGLWLKRIHLQFKIT